MMLNVRLENISGVWFNLKELQKSFSSRKKVIW